MRLIVIVLTILLFIGILGFVLTNLDTRVGVTFWNTPYPEVPLFAVVIASILAGIVYAGVIAIAEGAQIRFVNRRLTREVQKLETELNFLRTQRQAGPGERGLEEPPSGPSGGEAIEGAAEPTPRAPAPAPVYDAETEEWTATDPGDDAYSGRRGI